MCVKLTVRPPAAGHGRQAGGVLRLRADRAGVGSGGEGKRVTAEDGANDSCPDAHVAGGVIGAGNLRFVASVGATEVSKSIWLGRVGRFHRRTLTHLLKSTRYEDIGSRGLKGICTGSPSGVFQSPPGQVNEKHGVGRGYSGECPQEEWGASLARDTTPRGLQPRSPGR